jgi:hypothetical protein
MPDFSPKKAKKNALHPLGKSTKENAFFFRNYSKEKLVPPNSFGNKSNNDRKSFLTKRENDKSPPGG